MFSPLITPSGGKNAISPGSMRYISSARYGSSFRVSVEKSTPPTASIRKPVSDVGELVKLS